MQKYGVENGFSVTFVTQGQIGLFYKTPKNKQPPKNCFLDGLLGNHRE
jgi:hypothetical protein